MIFKPELVKQIRSERKTMTRRPIKPGETECRYQPGKTYAVQPGRGKESVARITIVAVRREKVGEIIYQDARREGFVTTQEFKDDWTALYGSFDPDMAVWVISFRLGDFTDHNRLLAASFGPPHGDYTDVPALSARGEQSAVSEQDQERFARQARERDHARLGEPMRKQRDTIARALAEMREEVGSKPLRDSVRRLEAELRVLDRKLAA